jgi:hypothetical protein
MPASRKSLYSTFDNAAFHVTVTVVIQQRLLIKGLLSERGYGSTRVTGHALLAWLSSRRMVVYIYYKTRAGNSNSSQLGSPQYGKGSRYGPSITYKKSHTCRVTLLQLARRAAVLGQHSSLRPHWLLYMQCTITCIQLNPHSLWLKCFNIYKWIQETSSWKQRACRQNAQIIIIWPCECISWWKLGKRRDFRWEMVTCKHRGT